MWTCLFFSSRGRHTIFDCDWSSDVCSSDLDGLGNYAMRAREPGLAVVISDLMDPGGFETGVRALLERRFGGPPIPLLAPPERGPGLTRGPPPAAAPAPAGPRRSPARGRRPPPREGA